MEVREEAIFINGVYRGVIEEILLVQEHVPEHIMFLQPHSAERIVHLADHPPSVEDRVRLFLSTTEELPIVRYTAEIVGWDNKDFCLELLRWWLHGRCTLPFFYAVSCTLCILA